MHHMLGPGVRAAEGDPWPCCNMGLNAAQQVLALPQNCISAVGAGSTPEKAHEHRRS